MVLPLTAPIPGMAATIGKGLLVRLEGTGDGEFAARVLSYVAIYSAIGLCDDALQAQFTSSMLRAAPSSFTRLARHPHAERGVLPAHVRVVSDGVTQRPR